MTEVLFPKKTEVAAKNEQLRGKDGGREEKVATTCVKMFLPPPPLFFPHSLTHGALLLNNPIFGEK